MPSKARSRDGWVMVGMAIAATSAAVASFTGLRGLALLAGWPEHLAWLLPITIDAYAMTAARVWLTGTSAASRALRFARTNAVGAILASIVGNSAYHAISAGLIAISWPVVVIVGAVPAAVLGLTAHLHALRTLNASQVTPEAEPESGPESEPATTSDQPVPRTRRRPKSRTDDDLLAAARAADARHRATHDGKPIPRDALRTALRIAGPRASELRRQLAAEADGTAGGKTEPSQDVSDSTTPLSREEALTH